MIIKFRGSFHIAVGFVLVQIYINQNEWQAYVPGTICTPHQIPCDSEQRRLLSIKMAVFMDRVCKMMCAPFVGRFNFYLFSARGTEQAEQPLG